MQNKDVSIDNTWIGTTQMTKMWSSLQTHIIHFPWILKLLD